MVFHWSLSDCKYPQVSRTFLSIPVDLNEAVFWMVATCLLISKSSSSYSNPLMTVSNAPITIGITVTIIIIITIIMIIIIFFVIFHTNVNWWSLTVW